MPGAWRSYAWWLAIAVMPAAAVVACATGDAGDVVDSGAPIDASKLDAIGKEAATGADAGDDSASSEDAAEAGIAVGNLAYLCPVQFSVGCAASDQCESTCVGQFQGGSTCTWYAAGAVPNTVSCTAVTDITTIYTCPSQLSTGCDNNTVCESTCMGQYQAASTCSVSGPGGVASNVSCTSELGVGPVPLYQCPTMASVNCVSSSSCQSTCVGQISNLSTCTWRGMNGVGTDVDCTSLGTQTF